MKRANFAVTIYRGWYAGRAWSFFGGGGVGWSAHNNKSNENHNSDRAKSSGIRENWCFSQLDAVQAPRQLKKVWASLGFRTYPNSSLFAFIAFCFVFIFPFFLSFVCWFFFFGFCYLFWLSPKASSLGKVIIMLINFRLKVSFCFKHSFCLFTPKIWNIYTYVHTYMHTHWTHIHSNT